MAALESAGSYVKINRTMSGWTWNIAVIANGESIEHLREAKEKAILLDAELREEFLPKPDDDPEDETVY